MSLTPEEREALLRRRAQLLQLRERAEGNKSIDAAADAAGQPRRTRDFSAIRVIGGGVRDAFEGVLDTIDDVGDYLNKKADLGGVVFGSSADNGILQFVSSDELNKRGGDILFGKADEDKTFIADLPGSEDAGGLEKALRGITSFAVPFTAAFKVGKGLQAMGIAGGIARGALAGAAADFTQINPIEGNIVNVMGQFGITPPVLEDLASEEDDSRLMARFKATAGGAVVGVAADGLVEAGGKLLRFYRDWKGTREAAEAVIAEARRGSIKLDLPDTIRTARGGASEGAQRAADEAGPIPVVEADEVLDPVAEGTVLRPRSDEPEDILEFLQSKAGDIHMSDEAFERFARNLMDGDPENALAHLGIDPLKMDFSKFKDPDMLGRFQTGLVEVYEKLAARLGRTGQRVSQAALLRGARSMGSTPEVLKELYGSTNKLGETLMASRMFVGAHAHKMVGLAERAAKEIADTGAPGQAWAEFLEAFHLQAYFLGALRGAGSEVARALRSLQFKLAPKARAKVVGEAFEADEAARAADGGSAIEKTAQSLMASLETNAEKLEALQKIAALKGDVEELSRRVRSGNLEAGKRVSQAIKETIGSLFSASTATMNVLSGGVYMSANLFGRFASAVARSPMLLKGGKEALQARRAIYEAWAYADGILGGFREATSNTLQVLEREFLSEFSLSANALGFDGLAQRAMARVGELEGRITGHFERADVVTSKAFAISGSERRALEKAVGHLGGPQFFQAGLKGLLRTAALSVNTVGTAFRTGTTLFINLPDEFVGTLAKRAGAYSEAVRIAAKEAANYGLEGKQAGDYLKARAVQLFGDGPKGWSEDAFEDGARHAIARAGETEARMVLFQDELEGKLNRGIASFMNNKAGGVGSIIIPFVKTPLRILERTARDFTPWGLARERVRNAILHGSPAERDEALARMSLGMMALFTGYQLAEDRTIVGHDGGYTSAARDAGRDSYSLRVGDDIYEFGRIDPLGTLLGIGADMHEYLAAAGDDPEASNLAIEATEGFLWSITTNMLSKTWLTSLRQLTDLAGATSSDDFKVRLDKFAATASTRFVPAAGVQRTLEAWSDASLREAAGFFDGARRSTLGAGGLPEKRDFLGRPIERQLTERAVGLPARVGVTADEDPVMAEFEALSVREPASMRRQRGVKLDAQQFSRFLELRGQVVRDPKTGLTMEETLQRVVTHPRYQALPKAAKVKVLREATDGFTKLANEALTNEDEGFALAQLRLEVFELAGEKGLSPEQRDLLADKASTLYQLRNQR